MIPGEHYYRAFLVQFHAATDPAAGAIEGRIEHIASGEALRFHSREEFLTFMWRYLTEAPRVSECVITTPSQGGRDDSA